MIKTFKPNQDNFENTVTGSPCLSGIYGIISDDSKSLIKNSIIDFGQAGFLNINDTNTILLNNDYAIKKALLYNELSLSGKVLLNDQTGDSLNLKFNFGQLSSKISLLKKDNYINTYKETPFSQCLTRYNLERIYSRVSSSKTTKYLSFKLYLKF